MTNKPGITLAVTALFIYVVGGLATFGGLALIGWMRGRDLLGWGDGASIGYLFLCGGLCLSVLGVLCMRILRNRGG